MSLQDKLFSFLMPGYNSFSFPPNSSDSSEVHILENTPLGEKSQIKPFLQRNTITKGEKKKLKGKEKDMYKNDEENGKIHANKENRYAKEYQQNTSKTFHKHAISGSPPLVITPKNRGLLLGTISGETHDGLGGGKHHHVLRLP
jgi:Ulp1 family protease